MRMSHVFFLEKVRWGGEGRCEATKMDLVGKEAMMMLPFLVQQPTAWLLSYQCSSQPESLLD